MDTKEFRASVKSVDADAGTFEAYASTYDTDSCGDKVVPGAFKRTLEEWQGKGAYPPLCWTHDTSDPFSFIGEVTDAEETDNGLLVKGKFDLDGGNPKAQQVYKLVKGGRISQLSFMYSVKDSEYVGDKKDDHDGAQVLLKDLDLHEITICHLGMNRATRVLSVKSGESLELKSLTGSYEDVMGAVCDALQSYYGEDSWAWPIATYSDRVVYRVDHGAPANSGTWQLPYTVADDGTVAFSGDPVRVEVTEVVVEKAREALTKVGRTISATNDEKLAAAHEAAKAVVSHIADVRGQNEKTTQESQQNKDEEPEAKADAEELTVKSDESVRPVPVGLITEELELLALTNSDEMGYHNDSEGAAR